MENGNKQVRVVSCFNNLFTVIVGAQFGTEVEKKCARR
jgi:hypothetical protein